MVVSSFVNGEERIVLFDLEGGRPEQEAEAAPETTYASLKKGDRGEEVKALQARLVELKYLDEKPDGIFGKNTEYVVDPEEVLADNFAYALIMGPDGYDYASPDLIRDILNYLSC